VTLNAQFALIGHNKCMENSGIIIFGITISVYSFSWCFLSPIDIVFKIGLIQIESVSNEPLDTLRTTELHIL
jgi:hypothetical protein